MCYDNYPENNKYHRKILQTTKGLFYLAVCRICFVIFVLNVQYLRTPIFKLFQLRVTL